MEIFISFHQKSKITGLNIDMSELNDLLRSYLPLL